MLLSLYAQNNVLSFMVLLIIYIYVNKKTELFQTEQKLFLGMIITNAMILIMDTAMWLLDGRRGMLVRVIFLLVTAVYYILNPTICMLWSLYADYQVYRDDNHTQKLLRVFLAPVCVNALFAILSMFGNFTFTIDNNNVYHRGRIFIIMFIVSYFYLAYTLLFAIKKRHNISRRLFRVLVLFVIPPLVGGFLQTLFYGLSIIWTSSTISILIVFISIQNNQLHTDYLTGLYNRRQLDRYIGDLDKRSGRLNKAGIMIDLNCFKSINDQYGHAAGDQALENTADILRKTFKKTDFLARYGGDEFIVIANISDMHMLDQTIDRLHKNVERFNQQKITPYAIQFSVGYDLFDTKRPEMTIQDFLLHIDQLMYENKKSLKKSE